MSFYKTLSKYYDSIFVVDEIELDFIKSFLPSKGHILDVACGTGQHSIPLYNEEYVVDAFDLDETMIKIAKSKEPLINFSVNDMQNLGNYKSNSYDLVLCFGNSLVHLDNLNNIRETLKEFYRLLKPQGTLLIQNVNFDRIRSKDSVSLPTISNSELTFFRQYEREENHIIFKGTIETNDLAESTKTKLYPLSKNELERSLKSLNFSNLKFYGNFKKAPFNIDASFPIILSCNK